MSMCAVCFFDGRRLTDRVEELEKAHADALEEIARLKALAEPLAHYTDCYATKWPDSGANFALADYRAAYPKEPTK